MDYFIARYYNGAQGRFTSPDPVFFQAVMMNDPQRFNLYAYVRNNPLKYIDPKGEAIQLSDDPKKRQEQLNELCKDSNVKNCSYYLYANPVTDKKGATRYFAGIYTNGADGKGPAFGSLNAASGTLARIIGQSQISSIDFVQGGTRITNAFGKQVVIGNIQQGRSPGLTLPTADGGAHIWVLDPSEDPGKLPGSMMGTGFDAQTDAGYVMMHELGHGQAIINGQGGNETVSNATALDLENQARKARNPKNDVRVFHDAPGTLPRKY